MNYRVPPSDATQRIEGERVRVLVIGSRDGVTQTIHTLYRLGFADVGAWSPVLPAPNSENVMSILTRPRQ